MGGQSCHQRLHPASILDPGWCRGEVLIQICSLNFFSEIIDFFTHFSSFARGLRQILTHFYLKANKIDKIIFFAPTTMDLASGFEVEYNMRLAVN